MQNNRGVWCKFGRGEKTPLSLVSAVLSLMSGPVSAEVLHHNGYLLDAQDRPVDAAAAPLSFALYDAVSGGLPSWTAACAAAVRQGRYAVTLGDGACGDPIPATVLTPGVTRYLQVSVQNVALLPRLPIGSVPSALKAASADRLGSLAPTDVWTKAEGIESAHVGAGTLQEALEARIPTALGPGRLLVGNAAGQAAAVIPSGDVSVSSTGVFTLSPTVARTAGDGKLSAAILPIGAGGVPILDAGSKISPAVLPIGAGGVPILDAGSKIPVAALPTGAGGVPVFDGSGGLSLPGTLVVGGPVSLSGTPTASQHAASKAYVDSAVASASNSASGAIVQMVTATSTATASLDVTGFTEANSSYRISFTPRMTGSKVLVEYSFSINTAMASNTIFHMQLVRNIGGAEVPVGVGPASGSRQRTSYVSRPSNGYDSNDMQNVYMTALDTGLTAGVSYTYGFKYRRENGGGGTTYFNASAGDTGVYGFSGVMLMKITEIAP